MSSLNEDEASVIWTNWEFKSLDSEDNIRHDIAHFPSIGIRERSLTESAGSLQEAAKETLVSWIRTTKNGWMGNTFTLPHHRRRGLASRATLALARQMLQEGFFAYVAIEDINTASVKFHESLGFKRQLAITVVVLVPAETTGQDYLE
uniref:N-acetyltransferase domain-containing protein n=1 Tax=Scylla olivacea TaxID=85551 RepID=A0A0P4WA34_SCYOL